uniref:Uncharacterized protein n=1 Tax=Glossina austeni TaxID=7395 RepID=A0A1A9UJM7_GLOAU
MQNRTERYKKTLKLRLKDGGKPERISLQQPCRPNPEKKYILRKLAMRYAICIGYERVQQSGVGKPELIEKSDRKMSNFAVNWIAYTTNGAHSVVVCVENLSTTKHTFALDAQTKRKYYEFLNTDCRYHCRIWISVLDVLKCFDVSSRLKYLTHTRLQRTQLS